MPESHSQLRSALLHVGSAFLFVGMAVLWSWPLARHVTTDLPGAGIGDNGTFLWNYWWMRTALASHVAFFHTNYMFAPFGTDLTLHSHSALPAFIGATLLARLNVLTSLNVTVIAGLALNGFCAYLLAWWHSRDRAGALLAGLIFGGSPYITAHLHGHFNLTMAWPIPLFAAAIMQGLRGSFASGVAAGVVLGATAYTDNYYVVYELAFTFCVVGFMATNWSIQWHGRPPYGRRVWGSLLLLVVVDLALLGSILVTGGYTVQVGRFRIWMISTFNLMQILWLLVFAVLWILLRPRVRVRWCRSWSGISTVRALGAAAVTFLVVALPLVLRGIQLLASGEYVTQHYTWRNAPVGIDVASLVFGNPFQSIWGSTVSGVYSRFGINLIESGGWLGVAPLVLAAIALSGQRVDTSVRTWTGIGAFFFVWALGSHLHAFGQNTGMILPETLLRLIPIASNARMPGRAIVMVYLALAMLAPIAIRECRRRVRYGELAAVLFAIAVVVDFTPLPFPTQRVECPPTFSLIRDRPEQGAVAVLPLGVADGFGDLTPLDRQVLACQPVFDRPLVGGFVARLSPSVLVGYRDDPLLAAWLRLSGASPAVIPEAPLPDRQLAQRRLAADNIAFIVLNRRTASTALQDYVENVLPVRTIAADSTYVLFEVDR